MQATAAAAATPSLPPCPTDVKNHGEYVSSVAHDKSTKGRDHGAAVSAAAHSDCGKDTAGEADAAESPEPAEVESPEASDSSDSGSHEKKASGKHGKGHNKD